MNSSSGAGRCESAIVTAVNASPDAFSEAQPEERDREGESRRRARARLRRRRSEALPLAGSFGRRTKLRTADVSLDLGIVAREPAPEVIELCVEAEGWALGAETDRLSREGC
jgi:hypothetical protein